MSQPLLQRRRHRRLGLLTRQLSPSLSWIGRRGRRETLMDRRAESKKAKVEAKRPLSRKSAKEGGGKVRDLEKRLAEALTLKAAALGQLQTSKRELAEALEQQTATSAILRVISSSRGDMQPVFEAIADGAMRLFGAWAVLVWRGGGEFVRLAAARGGVPGTEAMLDLWRKPWRPEAGGPLDRSIRSRAMQQIVDAETDELVGPIFR